MSLAILLGLIGGLVNVGAALDVVLVGYRGVDGSSVLDCPEVVSVLKHGGSRVEQELLR